MIEEMIYDKIAEELRVVADKPFDKGKRPVDKKVNRAYRAGLINALLVVRNILQIEE